MTRAACWTAAAVIAATATVAGCGSSNGPQAVLDVAGHAGVVAACADVQTAQTDRQAGDQASAASAMQSAVAALRQPPADPSAAPVAATIATRLAGGDTASAITAGSTFCATRGQ